MIDLVKLILTAGDGGLGKVSFLRERRIPKGGPDGGDGGKGGSVIIRGNKNLATLKNFKGKVLFEAEDGHPGEKKNMIGAKGKDLVLDVPIGTSISVVAENGNAKKRRTFVGINSQLNRDGIRHEKYYLEKEGMSVPPREVDSFYLLREAVFDEKLAKSKESLEDVDLEVFDLEAFESTKAEVDEPIYPDVQTILSAVRGFIPVEVERILEDGQEVVICQGGFGGRGNDRFKSSRNVTPLEAEYGSFGEKRAVVLELKLLADVGLVGFPNAGKSTLLSVVTKARPKIASYPFTTIEPNLGILEFGDYQQTDGIEEIVIADIPGLIDGASEGKGLGHSFLRHVENCSTMLYVLALNEADVFDQEATDKQKAEILYKQLTSLQKELENHAKKSSGALNSLGSKLFEDKKFLVSVNKIDLYSESLISEIKKLFKKKKISPIFFSGATKIGMPELAGKLREVVSLNK
ncbi:50S ribosome-binding GTPase [Candidatus Woesebacteria bacterium]|nr:50S ribosome-binding GTPase [Candidatus Woesebacteria bacterium]